ncbi:hypothetical protein EYW49_15570 [Siculibacillus lacustris]|uniref:L,D-TPase catalytic domain-containing protein n=1 Tax=Siculibacillus lacustris TaxID=1549641 RepID=A0A4Q9VLE3_9HYPH|nr:L,D-transpeptidase family protein [Siculibacillus lacustris]TBW35811.1 hypothetical protein EYW49_15570 [Siculibacillus lacustris]
MTAAFFAPASRPARRPTRIRVHRRPGTLHLGVITVAGLRLPCALGRTGITRFKREGDGATPAGRLQLLSALWRADRALPPRAALTLTPIRADAGWSDDPSDGRYNRPVRLPFAGSHEGLRRDDALYDRIGILDWNVRRRRLGAGSAIFLHQARPDYAPTAGCIALAAPDLTRLLGRLGRRAAFVVV